jgi:hypothetical protein
MKKLYNLTHEDKYYVSSIEPTNLPEDNYCFVEIEYVDENKIIAIKGNYKRGEIVKECILSDLMITKYIEKLNIFLKREDIDRDKIHLDFVENISEETERITKIFILLISSYLIYFNFLDFPYTISLELLNNTKFKWFTSFSPTNDIEKSFMEQVSKLHRYFSPIFDDTDDKIDDIFNEIREYKKRLFADLDKRAELFAINKQDIDYIKDMRTKLETIFKIF